MPDLQISENIFALLTNQRLKLKPPPAQKSILQPYSPTDYQLQLLGLQTHYGKATVYSWTFERQSRG